MTEIQNKEAKLNRSSGTLQTYAKLGEKTMIDLSREDWAEIYYALDSKVNLIAEGSPKDRLSQRWIKHLEAIKEAIGPDGETAADEGVYPQASLEETQ